MQGFVDYRLSTLTARTRTSDSWECLREMIPEGVIEVLEAHMEAKNKAKCLEIMRFLEPLTIRQ